jgi:hypothetical protein
MSLMAPSRRVNFFLPYLDRRHPAVFRSTACGTRSSAKGVVVIGHEANPDLESKGLTDVEPPFKN